MGDTIVFRYNGNSKFSIIIFDKLGCENALSVIVDPSLAHVQERHTNATETVNRSNIHPQPVQVQSNIEAVDRAMQVQSPVESLNNSHVLHQPVEIHPSTSRVNGPPEMESPPTKRQRRPQMEKSCQGNMPTINISSSGLSLRF